MTDPKAQAALARYKAALLQIGDDETATLPLAAEAIAGALIAKGLLTKLEFYEALAAAAEKTLAESRTEAPAPRSDIRVN